jgi:uncharacterized protein YvpB
VSNTGDSTINRPDRVALLLRRAEAAAQREKQNEARHLFKAVLRQDPTNDQALLWMVYLAEDGQASLNYLTKFLDAHPDHPQAREAVRWARRRTPTSAPTGDLQSEKKASAAYRRTRRAALGGVALGVLLALAIVWVLGRSPASPVQAGAPRTERISAFPTATPRPLIEIVQIVIPVFTLTPTPTSVPAPTVIPTPGIVWVPVQGHPQTYSLSCESRSATDLAGYWGVSVDETQFLVALGTSDNPHQGFVGDVNLPPGSLPPDGYGVYAEPVAATLRDYGLAAQPVYGLGLDRLRSELSSGRPVLVWATYSMIPYEPIEWMSGDGRISSVIPFMHTFLVIGFDEQGVFVLDAFDATVQHYPYPTFVRVWDLFDQMAVIVDGSLP